MGRGLARHRELPGPGERGWIYNCRNLSFHTLHREVAGSLMECVVGRIMPPTKMSMS